MAGTIVRPARQAALTQTPPKVSVPDRHPGTLVREARPLAFSAPRIIITHVKFDGGTGTILWQRNHFTGIASGFGSVVHVTTDRQRNVWTKADENPAQFKKWSPAGDLLLTVDDPSLLQENLWLVTDSQSNLYALETLNFSDTGRVWKLDSSGVVVWSTNIVGTPFDGYFDHSDNIYVRAASSLIEFLQKIDSDGNLIWRIDFDFLQQIYVADSRITCYGSLEGEAGGPGTFLFQFDLDDNLMLQVALSGISSINRVVTDLSGIVVNFGKLIPPHVRDTVAKFDFGGELLWENLGGQGGDMAIDSVGNIFVNARPAVGIKNGVFTTDTDWTKGANWKIANGFASQPGLIEMITNGSFDTDTAWTKGTNWQITGGKASQSTPAASVLSQTPSPAIVQNIRYVLTFDVFDLTAGSLTVKIGNSATQSIQSNGSKKLFFVAGAGSLIEFSADGTWDGKLDDVSLKKKALPANSVLSQEPSAPIEETVRYVVRFTVSDRAVGTLTVKVGGSTGQSVSGNGSEILKFVAGTGSLIEFAADGVWDGKLDGVSINAIGTLIKYASNGDFIWAVESLDGRTVTVDDADDVIVGGITQPRISVG